MWKNKYDKKDPKNHHFEWLFSKKIASVRKFATKKKTVLPAEDSEERQNPLLQFLERNLNVKECLYLLQVSHHVVNL
jgi:hypothetical protein